MFRAYPKIHRLGKEETDGILNNPLTIQEKVDGANVSIWLHDGKLMCGSRTRVLEDDDFNGFIDYVNSNPKIRQYLKDHPTHRLYGEWLVRHTIQYNETAYKKLYLFDVYDDQQDFYHKQKYVREVARAIDVEHPEVFADSVTIDLKGIETFVGQSTLGKEGEGVVLKPYNFKNKFGDHAYAKIVTQKFKENNAVVFGGNNKHSDTYWEMFFVNKYCTLPRVQKIMNKMQPKVNERLHMEHTQMIGGAAYHDLITEESWEMVRKLAKSKVNFRYSEFQRLATKKFIQIYHDILNENISVADKKEVKDVPVLGDLKTVMGDTSTSVKLITAGKISRKKVKK